MNFPLDTNVVSEWTKPRPDPGVTSWLAGMDEDRIFISVVTLAELRHDMTLVTRNVSDFEVPGIRYLNPWSNV